MDKSVDMAGAARQTKFTATMKWSDWAPTFQNNLRLIPNSDGVPLICVCRNSDGPDTTPNVNFVNDYVMMAPINNGEAYTIDITEVYIILIPML